MNLSKDDIAVSIQNLLDRKALMGVSFNTEINKKKGGYNKFFSVNPLPIPKIYKIWDWIMDNSVTPEEFHKTLQFNQMSFKHSMPLLLIGEGKIVYNTTIDFEKEEVGRLSLIFSAKRDLRYGLKGFFKNVKLKEVHIEDIELKVQSSGYTSLMFKEYEKLFGRLGFNRITLFAALNIGKYFWAKKGYDFINRSDLLNKKKYLKEIIQTKNIPVKVEEIEGINSAYDLADFGKKEGQMLPAYCNSSGFYKLEKDDEYSSPGSFHIGKSFLLSTEPWNAYKPLRCGFKRLTGLIYSPAFLKHDTGDGHPESSERLKAIVGRLKSTGLINNLVLIDPCNPDITWIQKVHSADYIKKFHEAVLNGSGYLDSKDCRLSKETYSSALLAAGAVMTGIDAVMSKRIDNGFCAVRPPGHHAEFDRAMGFCFINNTAVGAKYLQEKYGVKKIFILDWDVHHGNGTEHIFENDKNVYYASIHEHPTFCYPGTGRKMDRGKGEGNGSTLNMPLNPYATDNDCLEIFNKQLIPEIRKFKPDFILISAGFDAHSHDRIADLNLTESAYASMTENLVNIAEEFCEGRMISILEGGYNLKALAECVEVHIKTLMGEEMPDVRR